MRPGFFLCGCAVHHTRQEVLDNPDTFDSQAIDAEGYLICRHHKARQYGWRTDGYAMALGRDGKSMIRTFDQTIAREQRDLPPLYMPPAQIHLNLLADKTDNRDPQKLGKRLLDARSGSEGVQAALTRPDETLSMKFDRVLGPVKSTMPPLPNIIIREFGSLPGGGRRLMEYHRRLATEGVTK